MLSGAMRVRTAEGKAKDYLIVDYVKEDVFGSFVRKKPRNAESSFASLCAFSLYLCVS
jgi:hypothetical protein